MDDKLLFRYIKGNSTPEEKRQVVEWLNESPENEKKYLTLRKLYDLSIWNIDQQDLKSGGKRVRLARKIVINGMKIAAVLAVGILMSAIYFMSKEQEKQPEMQTVIAPPGQRTEILLSDGTKVWLNSGTTLSFPEDFSGKSRDVYLDGEGYFDVSKREGASFTVNTGKYHIRVLGTEFNVKSYLKKGAFETSLLKGKVDVFADDMKEHISMNPDEIVVLTQNGLQKEQIANYNYFKWKEGLICFEKENLASLFVKLELYYDIKIQIDKKSLLNYSYTGKFRTQDGIEHVLKVLQLEHTFEYVKNDDNNSLIIK